MAFVKLDTAILDSTLWIERDCREVFITALLMADPHELTDPAPQLCIKSLEGTGWIVPPGWYGFVKAAGAGIVRRAGIDNLEAGLMALVRLGQPEQESRSQDFEGRRLVRVDGGFVVLNYMKYRDRDHSAKDRMRRLRLRKKEGAEPTETVTPNGDGVTPNGSNGAAESVTVPPNVTHSRCRKQRADGSNNQSLKKLTAEARATRLPADWELDGPTEVWTTKERPSWDKATIATTLEAFRDHWKAKPGQGGTKLDWNATWRNWVRNESVQKGKPKRTPLGSMSDAELMQRATALGASTKGLSRFQLIDKIREREGAPA